MTDDSEKPLSELLKPLSGKVQPKRTSWSDTIGSKVASFNRSKANKEASVHRRSKKRKKPLD